MSNKNNNGNTNGRRGNGKGNQLVKAPVAARRNRVRRAPHIQSNDRMERVKHKEYIADVTLEPLFAPQSVIFQPGLAAFQWLSVKATRWQQYRVNSLKFEYETVNNTGQNGKVQLAFEYNADEALPADSKTLSNYHNCAQGAPWRSSIVTVVDPTAIHGTGPRKYTRTSSVASDSLAYDAGKIVYAATDASGASQVIGNLWVHYDITFYVAQVSSTISLPHNFSCWMADAQVDLTPGVGKPLTFGTKVVESNGITYDDAKGEFTLPEGNYEVQMTGTAEKKIGDAKSVTQTLQWTVDGVAQTIGSYLPFTPGTAQIGQTVAETIGSILYVPVTKSGAKLVLNAVQGGLSTLTGIAYPADRRSISFRRY